MMVRGYKTCWRGVTIYDCEGLQDMVVRGYKIWEGAVRKWIPCCAVHVFFHVTELFASSI